MRLWLILHNPSPHICRIERYGYREDDFTILVDTDDPDQIKPTHSNMVRKYTINRPGLSDSVAGD